MLDKLKVKILSLKEDPILIIFTLLIPVIAFVIFFVTGSTLSSSFINSILFTISIYLVVFLIFILVAWYLYIKDLFEGVILKHILEKAFSFLISVFITLVFAYLVIYYAGFYIFETILKILQF